VAFLYTVAEFICLFKRFYLTGNGHDLTWAILVTIAYLDHLLRECLVLNRSILHVSFHAF